MRPTGKSGKYVHTAHQGHEAINWLRRSICYHDYHRIPYYRGWIAFRTRLFLTSWCFKLLAKKMICSPVDGSIIITRITVVQTRPTIIHQSSATGMQAIPTTGIAQGWNTWMRSGSQTGQGPAGRNAGGDLFPGRCLCYGGEVGEAFQFAALHQLPVIYVVQDNDWGISVSSGEARTCDAYDL